MGQVRKLSVTLLVLSAIWLFIGNGAAASQSHSIAFDEKKEIVLNEDLEVKVSNSQETSTVTIENQTETLYENSIEFGFIERVTEFTYEDNDYLVLEYRYHGSGQYLEFQIITLEADVDKLEVVYDSDSYQQGKLMVEGEELLLTYPLYKEGESLDTPSAFQEKSYSMKENGVVVEEREIKAEEISRIRASTQGQYENPPYHEIGQLLTEKALENGIPPEILKAIALMESGWVHFKDGGPNVSFDNGIGLMQVTDLRFDQEKLKYDIEYNIEAAIDILLEKWDWAGTIIPTIGDQDMDVLESWYFAILAYNGMVQVNSPIKMADGSRNAAAYQEKVYQLISESNNYLNISKLPFTTSDFEYQEGTSRLLFTKMHYDLNEPTITRHKFQVNEKVAVSENARVRSTPTTEIQNMVEIVKRNQVATILEGYVYDESHKHTTNSYSLRQKHYVWYKVELENGTTGYIASGLLSPIEVEDLGSPVAKLALEMEGENTNNFITSEFVQHVFKEAEGIELPRLATEQYELGDDVAKNDLQAGDVVFFQGTRLVSGIYLEDGNFLIVLSTGIEMRNIESEYYSTRFVGAKRYTKENTTVPEEDTRRPVVQLAAGMLGQSTNFITSEFVQHVFKEAEEIELPRLAVDQYALGQEVAKSDLRAGDVVFFQGTRLSSGIYLGDGDFLINLSSGVEVRDLNAEYYATRYEGAKRYTKENTTEPKEDTRRPAVKLAEGMVGNSTNFITSEFVQHVYKEAEGIELPRLAVDQYALGQEVAKGDLQAGDVVFFQGTRLSSGIYLGDGDFLINLSSGVEVRNLNSEYYATRYEGAKRYTKENTAEPEEDEGRPAVVLAAGMIGKSTNFITSEFVQYVYKEAEGIELPRLAGDQYVLGQEVAKSQLQAGDVVFFQGTRLSSGIYLGDGEFLINLSAGVEIRNLNAEYYASRYEGAKRY
ncbi:NlpC/P60 family protein [Halalkalibacter flavus]|uniref:NlpC/P60 family protein n=1 Tax=Halalkalibacter flavus TaxID=3090668 RepID=UPI002FCAED06